MTEESVKMPHVTVKVEVEMVLVRDSENHPGLHGPMFFAMDMCMSHVTDDVTNEELGTVGGEMGGVMTVHKTDHPRAWRIMPQEFWRAFDVAEELYQRSLHAPISS